MSYLLDTNIVSFAIKNNLTIDSDLLRVEGLTVENWLQEETGIR
jgi:predicted nucleic acid-binding protein